jgi:PAS domain S-box-containing protein
VNNLAEVVEAVRAVAHLLPTRVFVTDPTGCYVWGSVLSSEVGEITAVGSPATSDHRMVQPDGAVRWMRCATEALTDDHGAPIGYLSTLTDISDRVESEKRFRQIAEHTTDTVVRVDRTGKVTYISRAAELLGYEPDELAGISMAQLIHPDDLQLFADRDSLFDTDEVRQRRFRAITRDGEAIWVHARSQRALDPDTGEANEIQSSVREITNEIAAEDALRESEERFRCLAEATTDGVCISDEGIIVSTNAAFATLFRYEPGAVVGMPIRAFVEPQFHEPIADRLATVASPSEEFIGIRSDGTRFRGAATGRSVSYQGRSVRVTTITDLTDMKRTVALEERRRVARDLHDGLAHELAFVATKARASLRTPDSQILAQIANAAERALDEARRAISVLSSSLPERLDVAVAQTAEDLGSRHRMAVSLDLSPDVVVAGEVAENLLRILREAMTNAGRHGHANRVAVRLWRNGDVHLVVDDDGCGFVEDERARRGFGLLSMQERAEAMAGRLLVASSPGRGTCVEAVIP